MPRDNVNYFDNSYEQYDIRNLDVKTNLLRTVEFRLFCLILWTNSIKYQIQILVESKPLS